MITAALLDKIETVTMLVALVGVWVAVTALGISVTVFIVRSML